LMEKWGFGISRTEVLETISRYVNDNKIRTPLRGGVPADEFVYPFHKTHKLSLKKPQRIEAC